MRRLSLLLVVALSMSAVATAAPTWAGANGDNWNDANKWSGSQIPGASGAIDVPVIDNGSTVVMNSDVSPTAGTITGVTLSKGIVQIQPGAVFTAGVNNGAIAVQNASEIQMTGGNVTWTGGLSIASTLSAVTTDVAKITVGSGATLTSNVNLGNYNYIGTNSNGQLIVDGGTVNINTAANTPGASHVYMGMGAAGAGGGDALLKVNSGTLNLMTGVSASKNYFYMSAGTGAGGIDGIHTVETQINGGTVNVGCPQDLGGNGTNTGEWTTKQGGFSVSATASHTARLTISGGTVTFNQLLSLASSGVNSHAVFNMSGGTVYSKGAFNMGLGTGNSIANADTWNMSGGSFIADWTLSYTGSQGAIQIGRSVTGQFAVMNHTAGLVSAEGISIGAKGNSSVYNFSGGILRVANGDLAGSTTVANMSNALHIGTPTYNAGNGNFNWTGGTLQASGTIDLSNSATLAYKSLNNGGGTLSPLARATDGTGGIANEVAKLYIAYGYNVTSSAASLEITANGATTAGVNYDQITTPALTLNGSLAVTLGYTPSTSAFDALTIVSNTGGSAVSGTFVGKAEGTLFTIGAAASNHQTVGKVSYVGGDGNDVVLSLRSVRQADGDANGLVDQRDYALWFNNNGLNGKAWATGDWDNNGLVDQRDYALWFNNNGLSGDSGAVPEPATMGLLILGAAGLLRKRR